MKKYITLLFLSAASINFSQELTCKDFKNGRFYISTFGTPQLNWEIVREGNEQLEIYHDIPEEFIKQGFTKDSIHLKIRWIDDCNYRMFFDDSKGVPSEVDHKMTDSGGLLVEMTKIEGQCFYYISSITVENIEYITEGKICIP